MSDDPKPYTAAEAILAVTIRSEAAMPEAREPSAAVVADALHPTGRCTCTGEGRCAWCRRDAARAPVEPATEPRVTCSLCGDDAETTVIYRKDHASLSYCAAHDPMPGELHANCSASRKMTPATPPSAPVVEGVREEARKVCGCKTCTGRAHGPQTCRRDVIAALVARHVEARVEQVLGDLEYTLLRDRGQYEDELEHAKGAESAADEDVLSGMVTATDAALREVNALRTRTRGDGK